VKQLGFFIATSLILHLLITSTTLYWADQFALITDEQKPTEIVVVSPNELEQKIEKTRQKIKENKSEAAFDSEQTQRVEKQTQASQLGLTNNSAAAVLSNKSLMAENEIPTKDQIQRQKSEDGDIPEFEKMRRQQPQSQSLVNAPSSISVQLPNDIQRSNATNLNTDASTFYSFYSRVEELFYVRWVERVNYYWDRISLAYKKNVLAGRVWSTEIEVWLNSKGEFHSAYIRKASGYQPFDDATVYAFKNAGFFPNPPRAKVESDGYVRLRYRFNVNITP
jgi:TonB family protein